MSRLVEFRHLEKQLAAQLAELEAMKNDEGLKREIVFEQKLRALLVEYGVGLRQVIELLDPKAGVTRTVTEPKQKPERKPRALKVYLNPHSGEVVETKGGNHKTLKLWKSQYGASTVESWLKP
ncbi:histone-like nucleoid-structuring protein, MvaT/MvaU family [Pseudomonas fontis]|uniref:DNA binding protein n=1 Tax=Pseudomonas fontis TaxID=2942633 RepID=A0ABT5NY90_9PSED|nr:histone-like nucleoid-structuring protein, MvaT/MvaU family [Pseudomonas fontis]MDD0976456.1 DNA binding protein [Pseudomonas fontis]MDD0993107.1 DNA binding protein [Pseudomonas fontis]